MSRIEDKKKPSSTTRTERPHLRLVRPEPKPESRPTPAVRRSGSTGDRFSDSGERDEAPTTRVSSILDGLQEPTRTGGTASESNAGEGILDNIVDTARDAAGAVTDFVGDLFNSGRDDSRLSEEREENATVAVIDSFDEENEEAEPTHGEKVESILMDHSGLSDEDIQRYRAGGGPGLDNLVEASPEEFGEALDAYIEGNMTGLLNGSSAAIEDILSDDNTSIRTINQSLGTPESRLAGNIANKFEDDPEFRARFLEYAGLDADATEREVMQALVDEVGDSHRSNENIREAKERYDNLVAEAYERGITTIDSSGNYASFARELEELGVVTDEQFHTDVLNNELVLSVGGTDSNGTTGIKDDEESSFSSPNAGADIAAQGTDVSTTIDGVEYTGGGTSFAAPQVAAAAAVIAERFPELTPAQIRQVLETTATNPGLDPEIVGAGILQQQAALAEAEQLAA